MGNCWRQAINYVPNAVPEGDGTQGLQPLGVAGEAAHLSLVPADREKTGGAAPSSVSLFDQGLLQVLQVSATGSAPKTSYVLALAEHPTGDGVLEPLSTFMTNPAGSAIVNAVGPIRQIVRGENKIQARYLVIVCGTPEKLGSAVQVQAQ